MPSRFWMLAIFAVILFISNVVGRRQRSVTLNPNARSAIISIAGIFFLIGIVGIFWNIAWWKAILLIGSVVFASSFLDPKAE